MINKEKIVFNTKKYYTPNYSGVTAVRIIKLIDSQKALVQIGEHTFVRELEHIYNQHDHARIGRRSWEHDERKRKKK